MTKPEQKTINELSTSFNKFIKEDTIWKKSIENQLAPILKEREAATAVANYHIKTWHYLLGFITAIGAIGLAFHYTIEPLWAYFSKSR